MFVDSEEEKKWSIALDLNGTEQWILMQKKLKDD